LTSGQKATSEKQYNLDEEGLSGEKEGVRKGNWD